MEERDNILMIQRDLTELRGTIDTIKDAIIGNEITKDKGIMGRVERIEAKVRTLEEEVKDYNLSRAKNSVYIAQLAYVSGAIAIAFIGFVVNQILNK